MRIQLIVNLDVDLNGTSPTEIQENLENIIDRAYAEGAITRCAPAEIENMTVEVKRGTP